MTTNPQPKETFLQRVARLAEERRATEQQAALLTGVSHKEVHAALAVVESDKPNKLLNEQQATAVQYIKDSKPFVLTGAAGTGKTFTLATGIKEVWQGLDTVSFRDPTGNTNAQEVKPAFAICAFTNRAIDNAREGFISQYPALADDLGNNFMTISKLLEVAPVYYDEFNDAGEMVTKMRFEPKRGKDNKLPIKLLIVEESSTLGLQLWHQLLAALLPDCAIVFVGDINQIAALFGDSILQYALKDLPIVELTEIYRQAAKSPIIKAAHNVLRGELPVGEDVEGVGKFELLTIKSVVGTYKFERQVVATLKKAYSVGLYDPMQDMVLNPYNKGHGGTISLNTAIASMLDEHKRKLGTPNKVYEVASGFAKVYLAVGDRVYASKREGIIKDICINGTYLGAPTQPASTEMNRYGMVQGQASKSDIEDMFSSDAVAFSLDGFLAADDDKQDTVRSASHAVTVEFEDGSTSVLSSSGELNEMALGYALTTHKAIGCEYPNVFITVHDSQGTVAYNEWLYTAITRGAINAYLMITEQMLSKVVARKRIKGVGIEAKVNYFCESLEKKLSNPNLKPEARALMQNVWNDKLRDNKREGA